MFSYILPKKNIEHQTVHIIVVRQMKKQQLEKLFLYINSRKLHFQILQITEAPYKTLKTYY